MKIAALLAVAGLAGAAQAQSLTWMSDVPAGTELNPGDSIKVTLSASMESAEEFTALSATIFDTINALGGDLGDITAWEVLNDLAELTGDLTTTDGDSLFGTNAGQLTVFGPFSSDNPIDVLSFTWTAAEGGQGGDVLFNTNTKAAVLWVGDDKDTAVSVDANLSDTVFGWSVIPTPASAALLGLGGLALARRRR